MALFKKSNQQARAESATGFSNAAAAQGGRILQKNGVPNIRKRGVSWLEGQSWYHTLLHVSTAQFLLIIVGFYLFINLVFATVYYSIGTEHLGGLPEGGTAGTMFLEAYFFSAQTFTTVGYGRVNPTGFLSSAVAAFEALLGLLSFALATGLFYGRLARPRAYLKFFDKLLLAPYKNGMALMLRVAPYKNNVLTDAEVRLTVGITEEENGKPVNRFYQVDVEISRINTLTLSWTIVHPINEKSPFYRFSVNDFKDIRWELLIFLTAFDDSFSNTVQARCSYIQDELVIGEQFDMMYYRSDDGGHTVLDLTKLSSSTPASVEDRLAQLGKTDVASG